MKSLWIFALVLLFPLYLQATQEESIQDSSMDANWKVEDGSTDIESDQAATAKEAHTAWKKSCEAWKKEFREDNKDNKIISVNCGTPNCGGEAGSKTCTSKGTYKVKTRIR